LSEKIVSEKVTGGFGAQDAASSVLYIKGTVQNKIWHYSAFIQQVKI
jgi:hypothetical protein